MKPSPRQRAAIRQRLTHLIVAAILALSLFTATATPSVTP